MYRSGLQVLDRVLLGGQGCPPGSLVEIYGETGKTSLALQFCKQALEEGHEVGWVGTEQSLNLRNLAWAGIALPEENFLIARQSPSYSGITLARALLLYGAKVVVIDSLTALLGDPLDQPLFQVLSQGLPQLKRLAREQGALVIGTSQTRRAFRHTEVPAGWTPSLVKLMDARVQLWAGEGLYRGGEPRGARLHFCLTKNGPRPRDWGRNGRFNLLWGQGLRDLRNLAKDDTPPTGFPGGPTGLHPPDGDPDPGPHRDH